MGQEDIKVPIKIKLGNADFFTENLGSTYIPLNSTYKYGSKKIKPLGIRRFYFDKPQHDFLEYIGGDRRDAAFLNEMRYYQLDTSSLSHKKLKNYLDVLTGFNSKGDFIAIPDVNRNKNFNDDKSYLYKNARNIPTNSLYQLEKSCPFQKISIQEWDNGRIESFTRFIRLVPWFYFSFNRTHPPKSTKDSSDIVAQPYQYWKGRIRVNNRNYFLYLHNRRPQLRRIPVYAVELDVRETTKIDTLSFIAKYLYSKYHIRDTIPIGDKLFLPEGVSLTEKYLTLRYIGKNNYKYGYNPGSKVNEIRTTDIQGNVFDLSKLQGHYVLLDFWFIGCGACEAILPEIRKLNKQYERRGLDIVSISLETDSVKLSNYMTKNKMDWINIMGYSVRNNVNIIDAFKVGVYPTVILIDPNGKIVLRELGIDGFEKVKKYIIKEL